MCLKSTLYLHVGDKCLTALSKKQLCSKFSIFLHLFGLKVVWISTSNNCKEINKQDCIITQNNKLENKNQLSAILFLVFVKASEKKSRPLSATRRMEPKDKLDDNAEEIFKAMAEENQTIGERLWCHIHF